MSAPINVLVTGAGGYIGRVVVEELHRHARETVGRLGTIVAADLREPAPEDRLEGVVYAASDVRDSALKGLLEEHSIGVVAHLAAIVTPGKKPNRELEYSVDVLGTKNVLECSLAAGVRKVIITSSGAAYGYHADNPEWLSEEDALRGNQEFAYSDHKRLVEEMLARWREEHPELQQLILRPGTVLGDHTRNQITDLFDGKLVVGLRGAETPFVLIWDRDVAEIIVRGVLEEVTGAFNLAGDGALPMRELARMMGKPYLPLPVGLVRSALWVMKRLGRTQYGPEQVDFLRYRPVLSNARLKRDFPYTPRKTSREVFEHFLEARRHARA
ncbi:MAG: SDR family oxidoreductase [Deltaproteobacteria bacterium]|nr:SDR family oxidoreductase [Deltaproteobacteria bacterium]